MKKKFLHLMFVLTIFCSIMFLGTSCKKDSLENATSAEPPVLDKMSTPYNLDFVVMHNYVIDTLRSEYTPFFFVEKGKFDISGDNISKNISVTCTCINGTTTEDVDLFFSLVLNYMGFNAAEQDFRFTKPATDNTGTYIDFGSVFNYYSLDLYATTSGGKVLRKDHIDAGKKNTIDSRYWSE